MNDVLRHIRSSFGRAWVCLVLFILVLTGFMGGYYWYITGYLQREAMHQLDEASNHTSSIMTTSLLDKKKHLDKVANIVKYEDTDIKNVKWPLAEYLKNANVFQGVGFVAENGEYTVLADPEGLMTKLPYTPKDQRFFLKGMNGKDYLSVINGSLIFSELVTTSRGKGVLFALYNVEELQSVLSAKFFSDQGYSVIIDVEGNKLLWSDNAPHLAYESGNVFLNYLSMKHPKQENIKALHDAIAEKKSGMLTGWGFEPMYMYYRPLQIGDLYILTIIPQRAIAESYQLITQYTMLLFLILFIALVWLAGYLVYSEWRKKNELKKLLYVDELTGKMSYKKFQIDGTRWLRQDDDRPKALIAFDLDNFKLFNVLFGYQQGNRLLRNIADIFDRYVGKNGMFAHKYGDLYTILLAYKDRQELDWLCQGILREVRLIGEREYNGFRINASMGIYIVQPHEYSLMKMENYAILARREAKKRYEAGYRVYDEGLKNERIEFKQLVDNISAALEKGEFYSWFQPKYDAKTQRLVGAEALIRWIKPDGTMISPGTFIPLAERTGLIAQIDDYMFSAVCQQLQQWQDAGYPLLPISINVSRYSLYRKNFIAVHLEMLKQYGLPTNVIQLEVTEGTLYSELEVSEQIVDTLRERGIQVLIDDFGTGYSSISMVKRFNATALKIDKSFVDDMSSTGKKMLKYVIDIAKLMNMRTIAEGVETKEQHEFLRDQDCDVIQGYYFAKPMSAHDFVNLLKQDGGGTNSKVSPSRNTYEKG